MRQFFIYQILSELITNRESFSEHISTKFIGFFFKLIFFFNKLVYICLKITAYEKSVTTIRIFFQL